jgi:transcriptional regulator NrdR family protein
MRQDDVLKQLRDIDTIGIIFDGETCRGIECPHCKSKQTKIVGSDLLNKVLNYLFECAQCNMFFKATKGKTEQEKPEQPDAEIIKPPKKKKPARKKKVEIE